MTNFHRSSGLRPFKGDDKKYLLEKKTTGERTKFAANKIVFYHDDYWIKQ
jgi:hypothetical protein